MVLLNTMRLFYMKIARMTLLTFADARAWNTHHKRRSHEHNGLEEPPPQALSHVEPMPMLPEVHATTTHHPPNSQACFLAYPRVSDSFPPK